MRGSVGGLFGVGGAKLDATIQAGELTGSQVLRKAVIQTSFKELYEIEQKSLALRSVDLNCPPEIRTAADLEAMLDSPPAVGLLVDPSKVGRGELLEVDVELEADPIFHTVSVISTLHDLIEDKDDLFGRTLTSQLGQTRSMAQVLEILLAGLVPIRGRLVDYESVRIGSRDVLIHHALLGEVPPEVELELCPVFVVGVAQRDLFWKDIRRVLFSEAQYTVFCRLVTSGLADRWRPVKVGGVFAGISPALDEQIQDFGEVARRAMTEAADASSDSARQDASREAQLLKDYARAVVDHHRGSLEPEVIDALILEASPEKDWLESVDGRRPVFAKVTHGIEKALGVETPGNVKYKLRSAALNSAGVDDSIDSQASSAVGREPHLPPAARGSWTPK